MKQPLIKVVSVNVAQKDTLIMRQKPRATGSFKQPIATAVQVNRLGLAGDFIANKKYHGGTDQAVYLYSAEDMTWWQTQLAEQTIKAGFFGENLTIDAWWDELRVGDRLSSGSLVLEMTFPRVPCSTLAARVGDAKFVKQFVAAERPGLYARVLTEGLIQAGDSFTLTRAPADYPSMLALYRMWHAKSWDRALIEQTLQSPIAARYRTAFEAWLRSQ